MKTMILKKKDGRKRKRTVSETRGGSIEDQCFGFSTLASRSVKLMEHYGLWCLAVGS